MYNDEHVGRKRLRRDTVERVLQLPESAKFVNEFRLNFLKNLKDIPVSDKKIRLYDLERLRQRLMRLIDNLYPEKESQFSKFMLSVRAVGNILEMARNEMESKPNLSVGIINNNQGDMGELTDEQLQQRREELFNRARRAVESGISTTDSDSEGNPKEDPTQSPEVLLAASDQLPGDELSPGADQLSDIRQP